MPIVFFLKNAKKKKTQFKHSFLHLREVCLARESCLCVPESSAFQAEVLKGSKWKEEPVKKKTKQTKPGKLSFLLRCLFNQIWGGCVVTHQSVQRQSQPIYKKDALR